MEIMEYESDGIEEIKHLFIKTFTDSEGQSEGRFIGDLVSDFMTETDRKDLFIYIAREKEEIIGCIFFSRMGFEESPTMAFLLGPVAVHTDHQGNGVGQKLINWAHKDLKEKGVELVFTYGDINFYSRVGYAVISEEVVKAPLKLTYPEGWLARSLTGDSIKPIPGRSYCVKSIKKPEYW